MSMRIACDVADVFAAATEFAGLRPTLGFQPCTPSRPIAVGLFHGDADPIAPVAADRRNRNEWIARNGCSPTPLHAADAYGTADVYSGCAGGVEVLWRVLTGQGHFWPTGTEQADQRDRIWAFLMAHPRP